MNNFIPVNPMAQIQEAIYSKGHKLTFKQTNIFNMHRCILAKATVQYRCLHDFTHKENIKEIVNVTHICVFKAEKIIQVLFPFFHQRPLSKSLYNFRISVLCPVYYINFQNSSQYPYFSSVNCATVNCTGSCQIVISIRPQF